MIFTQTEDETDARNSARYSSEQSRRPISIVVADDQRLFCESIAGLLARESFISVVGVASNGLEAIELARQWRPACILMDVRMPQMDGIEATRQIKAEFPETKIILLTTFITDGYVLEGLAAGANGYILKDISAVGLISAICAVDNGEQVTAPDITSRMLQLLEKQTTHKGQYYHGLTAREMEMLVLITRGMLAKEISRTLAISEKTVRNHISSIYRKLNIFDRSQLVIYAMRNGLIDIHDGF
ncbi:MAG TPA: response regulator transcription factor [Ktedonobacteraceae bacterium]